MAAPRLPIGRLLIEHIIGLNQFENGLRRRVQDVLRATFREINFRLLTQYDSLTRFQRDRQLALFARVREMLQASYGDLTKLTKGQLFDLGKLEATFAEQVLRSAVGPGAGIEINTTRLTVAQVRAIADFPIQGLKIGEWWDAQGKDMALQVRRQVQIGLMQGEATYQLASRISGPRRHDGPTGVEGMSRRNAATIVRTAVTAVSSAAQHGTYAGQDPALTDRYQYVATLDDRTTVLCASLDGQIFRYDDPQAPRPPMHPNCRSVIIPVVNWPTGLGDLVPLQRAAQGGPTRAKTFETWLRGQSADVQNEVLGVMKGKLFRAGKITLKDLLRDDGTELTLPELAARLGLPLDALAG